MDKQTRHHIEIAAIIALSCGLAFGIGRFTAASKDVAPVTIDYFQAQNTAKTAAAGLSKEETGPAPSASISAGQVVASKKGTKYHSPWCPGASTISDANKIIFASAEEARAAGYEPAANCKGLK